MPRGIPNTAKNNPVVKRGGIEAADQPLGHTKREGDPHAATAAERLGETEPVQVADSIDIEWAENMKFMAEPVTIFFHESSDKEAPRFEEININGRLEVFERGKEKTVPRYFVDHLARMKVTTITSVERTNDEGLKYMQQVPYTKLKFPFNVVRDDNPLGPAWLKATLAMPG